MLGLITVDKKCFRWFIWWRYIFPEFWWVEPGFGQIHLLMVFFPKKVNMP